MVQDHFQTQTTDQADMAARCNVYLKKPDENGVLTNELQDSMDSGDQYFDGGFSALENYIAQTGGLNVDLGSVPKVPISGAMILTPVPDLLTVPISPLAG